MALNEGVEMLKAIFVLSRNTIALSAIVAVFIFMANTENNGKQLAHVVDTTITHRQEYCALSFF